MQNKAFDSICDFISQTLLSPKLWEQFPLLRYFILKFLAPGLWEKHKSDLARKVSVKFMQPTLKLSNMAIPVSSEFTCLRDRS